MADDDGERTEEPTPKRLDEARKRGEVAQSRDLSGVVVLAVAIASVLSVLGERLITLLAVEASHAWSGAAILPDTLEDFHALWLHGMQTAALGFLPFAALVVTAAVLVNVAQTGPLFSTQALAFRGSRIDPVKGLGRMVSPDRLFDLAKAIFKVGSVLALLTFVLAGTVDAILSLVAAPVQESMHTTRSLVVRVVRTALGLFAVLALIDLAWVRNRHRKKLRMTLREVRDEMRERDGSPQVRARRRQLQRELSRQRMIADVARADVVITNPTHFAVALRYARSEMSAPQVLARGRNHLAARIRAEALRHSVPIVENPPLARVLYRATRVGRQVPEHLFQAVAEVLAYVYRMDRRRAAAWGAEA